MWRLSTITAKNDNLDEISFVDVKELYDDAFEEKAKARVNLKRFKTLMAKAQQMDEVYRAQLGLIQATRYEEAA